MAREKLADIGDDAFTKGFLNKAIAQAVVNRLNTPLRVKLEGAPDAKVLETQENTVIDLTPTLGGSIGVWLVVNGGLAQYKFHGKSV